GGASLLRLFELPDDLGQLLLWIVRQGEVTLGDVATYLGRDIGAARAALETLAAQGAVQELQEDAPPAPVNGAEPRYRARLARRRARGLPLGIWDALDDEGALGARRSALGPTTAPSRLAQQSAPTLAERRAPSAERSLSEHGRFILSASPLAAGFLLTEW